MNSFKSDVTLWIPALKTYGQIHKSLEPREEAAWDPVTGNLLIQTKQQRIA